MFAGLALAATLCESARAEQTGTNVRRVREDLCMAVSLPPQDELRRRLRAARVLRDLNVAELAARVDPEAGLGERTLRKLESGETKLRAPLLRELAVALDMPYSWFACASIEAQFKPSAEWTDRLAALEARLDVFEREQGAPGANGDSPQSPEESQQTPLRRGPRGTRQARSS